ncbi:hypothetical protein, partial [Kitasatospora sp. NPDC001175]
GVYDKEESNLTDDVQAHSAEKFKGTEVICGVYDKPNFTDDVQAHSAEMVEGTEVICSLYCEADGLSAEM